MSDINLEHLDTYCGTSWVQSGSNLDTIWVQYGYILMGNLCTLYGEHAEISWIWSDIHLEHFNTYCGTYWVQCGYNLGTIWVHSYGELMYSLWWTYRNKLHFLQSILIILSIQIWLISAQRLALCNNLSSLRGPFLISKYHISKHQKVPTFRNGLLMKVKVCHAVFSWDLLGT